jgi:CRISPR-associated protein Csx14
MYRYVLLATVGQRPAAITMALDALMRNYAYESVVLLHTDPDTSGIAAALKALMHEMQTHEAYRKLSIIPQPMVSPQGGLIVDTDTTHSAQAYFHALFAQFRHYRREGYSVHVLVSGGRKAMSAYAVIAASYVLSYNDRLWTSVVPPDLIQADLWHAPPDRYQDVRVLSLPFKASQLMPHQIDDISLKTLVWGEHYDLRDQFMRELTPAERKVTEAIMQYPYHTDAQIAEHLQLAPKTIENHLRHIYQKLESYFEENTASNKRFFLRDVLEGRF